MEKIKTQGSLKEGNSLEDHVVKGRTVLKLILGK